MYFNILLYLIFVFMFICCVKPHRHIDPIRRHIAVMNHIYDSPIFHSHPQRRQSHSIFRLRSTTTALFIASQLSHLVFSKSNIHDTDSWSASVYLYRHRRIYDGIDRCYYKLHIPTQTGKYHNDGIRVLESTTRRTLRCTCCRR